ncbi:hypothetical protein PPUN110474_09900 [Pseudomonas putida]|nr:hypothetical protein PPUN110474_09900 [Pseudomonas putida]
MQTVEMQRDDHLVSELLYGQAQPLCGSGLDDASLIQIAKTEFADRAFCIVRNWMILDIMLPDNELQKVVAAGQHPIVLLAHEITYDSQASQPYQAPLVTGYGEDLYGCFFEAGPKMYVLAGRGARRYAAKPALVALEQMTTEAYAYGYGAPLNGRTS